ncbi:cytochrome P450 [Colletotrichum tofieldiae]|uniref:Cytochrome P450 n=1 Tax=Colletotrichum tofieldiae TaxID=708197 RepID=A0A166SCU7_9PEZI|nr:cytochrome P450 [Colletotrichum tofieldiae]GKT65448.1 cytochrome P450 [Colletotrichum tofieldiae]GKT71362.1 cytochrome P450 [Colletotrichum tofieldiae]GKT93711.1 cytochrome P450 [Colletotrichum tofieldiae]
MALLSFGLVNTLGLVVGLRSSFQKAGADPSLINLPQQAIAYCLGHAIYNLFLHPLAKFPGPVWMRVSRAPFCYKLLTGTLPFDMLELHKRYGPVVRIAPDELAFHDSRAWKDIMGHKSQGGAEMEKSMKFYRSVPNAPSDIVSSGREEHANLRRSLAHGFSERSMRDQQPMIKSYVDLLVQRLHQHGANGSKPLDLAAWYNYTTFDVIGDLAFGESFGCLDGSDYHPWVKAIFQMARLGTVLQTGTHYPLVLKLMMAMIPEKAKRERAHHEEFTEAKLKRRMELGQDRPDLIEGLLKKKDDWNMSFAKLKANSSILIIGGSETTATLLSGATYYLLMNPDALAKLTDEIRSAFKDESEIDFQSVSNLPYLLACLDEALRLYPPVPIGLPRIVPQGGANIADHYVPEGTTVSIYQWAMYHSEKNFRDPFGFHPERWLQDPAFASDNREAFQPFHVGPRNCIGRNLAYVEMRLILTRVLWNFDMKIADDSTDWAPKQKIYLLWEKGPLNAYLTPVQRS